MPLSDLHARKKSKNYTLLWLIIASIVFFFTLTIVKFKAQIPHEPVEQAE